ncbi:MAG: hypothetical protein ACK41E_04085 [Deinococcales bacterium]
MSFDPRQHLMNLKGKDYLPVAARLVWLNEEAPRYTIQSQILKLEDTYAIVQATVTVFDEANTPQKTASATKREDKTHFPDYLEKAETGAIGRALGMLGYGTQFAPEFDELNGLLEARVVDKPQIPQTRESVHSEPVRAPVRVEPEPEDLPRPKLSSLPMKPASQLSSPTNARKPRFEEAPPAALTVFKRADSFPDIEDGLEEYDHASVSDEDLFSQQKVERLLSIAGKLFNLRGEQLEQRLLEAAGKILKRSVADIYALHWRDGGEVMRQLEEQAIKRGVWERRN